MILHDMKKWRAFRDTHIFPITQRLSSENHVILFLNEKKSDDKIKSFCRRREELEM